MFELGERIGLTKRQVRIWFQNRRVKERKIAAREQFTITRKRTITSKQHRKTIKYKKNYHQQQFQTYVQTLPISKIFTTQGQNNIINNSQNSDIDYKIVILNRNNLKKNNNIDGKQITLRRSQCFAQTPFVRSETNHQHLI